MKRSEFLKLSCTGCLLTAAGLVSASSLLSSCSPAVGGKMARLPVTGGKMEVPLAQLEGKEVNILRGKGLDYDVAVHREGDGSYKALLLRCTHFENPVVPQGKVYHCNAHGSEFDLNGKVKKGPASAPLQQLPCTVTASSLIITV